MILVWEDTQKNFLYAQYVGTHTIGGGSYVELVTTRV